MNCTSKSVNLFVYTCAYGLCVCARACVCVCMCVYVCYVCVNNNGVL